MIRWALAAFLLLATACTPLRDSYPVPEQGAPRDGPEPEPRGALVSFSDPRSPDYIVDGFLDASPDQTWRWANAAPAVRVRVSDAKNLRLHINFAFPDESHTPLLPITVRYLVNDHLLDTVVYRKTGILDYRKPVPAEWVKPDSDNIIRCEVSPVYVAKADGVKLAMIISEIGFEQTQ